MPRARAGSTHRPVAMGRPVRRADPPSRLRAGARPATAGPDVPGGVCRRGGGTGQRTGRRIDGGLRSGFRSSRREWDAAHAGPSGGSQLRAGADERREERPGWPLLGREHGLGQKRGSGVPVPAGHRPVRAPLVSSCCFGGPERTTLFITTSQEDMPPEWRVRHPRSGHVFRADVGIRGTVTDCFRLPEKRGALVM